MAMPVGLKGGWLSKKLTLLPWTVPAGFCNLSPAKYGPEPDRVVRLRSAVSKKKGSRSIVGNSRIRGIASALAASALLALGTQAQAVPCGGLLTGGVGPNVGCQNGPALDPVASAADLNAGNYFGISSWVLLDSTADGVDSTYWSFLPGNPNGTHLGIFGLADGIWDTFSSLTVVLAGPGGALDSSIKWSAYLLPYGWEAPYGWSYDYIHKLGSASLFGAIRTVAVSEPAAATILVFATLGLVLLWRRRRFGAAS